MLLPEIFGADEFLADRGEALVEEEHDDPIPLQGVGEWQGIRSGEELHELFQVGQRLLFGLEGEHERGVNFSCPNFFLKGLGSNWISTHRVLLIIGMREVRG